MFQCSYPHIESDESASVAYLGAIQIDHHYFYYKLKKIKNNKKETIEIKTWSLLVLIASISASLYCGSNVGSTSATSFSGSYYYFYSFFLIIIFISNLTNLLREFLVECVFPQVKWGSVVLIIKRIAIITFYHYFFYRKNFNNQ